MNAYSTAATSTFAIIVKRSLSHIPPPPPPPPSSNSAEWAMPSMWGRRRKKRGWKSKLEEKARERGRKMGRGGEVRRRLCCCCCCCAFSLSLSCSDLFILFSGGKLLESRMGGGKEKKGDPVFFPFLPFPSWNFCMWVVQ